MRFSKGMCIILYASFELTFVADSSTAKVRIVCNR
jgi:hypothetical protein